MAKVEKGNSTPNLAMLVQTVVKASLALILGAATYAVYGHYPPISFLLGAITVSWVLNVLNPGDVKVLWHYLIRVPCAMLFNRRR